jgi:hypothetical protein
MRLKYLLIISFGIFSCSKKDSSVNLQEDSLNSKPVYSALTLDEYKRFYNSDSTSVDTLKDYVIDFDCAVLIYPTEEEIDEMKKKYGEDDF